LFDYFCTGRPTAFPEHQAPPVILPAGKTPPGCEGRQHLQTEVFEPPRVTAEYHPSGLQSKAGSAKA